MKKEKILGIFNDYDRFMSALKELKGMGIDEISTFTPVPFHEIDEVLGDRRSPLRFLTLTGGVLGFSAGAWLTVYCTQAYPMIVGGKPLISVPPYLIIAFELTILFSTLLTAIGYYIFSPITGKSLKLSYDPSFSEDKFGLSVESSDFSSERLKEVMTKNGAVETRLP